MNKKSSVLRTIRILTILAMICSMITSAAAAGMVAPFTAESAEGKTAQALADLLGIQLILTGDGTSDEAANRMLAEPGVYLCDTQAAPIAGLQGYTDEDLRTAMVPVCLAAESPLYIVMDVTKADEYGIRDAETMMSYINDHEYELTFARHTGADVTDRAVTLLSNEMAVLTDYFMPEEIPDVLRSGEADGAVMTGAALADNRDGLIVLCCLGDHRSEAFPEVCCAQEIGLPVCRGEMLWLFTSVITDTGEAEGYARIAAEGNLQLPEGFEQRILTGDALLDDMTDLFADLKEYMTSEGLFFYEE